METSFKLDGGNMLKIDWPDYVLSVLDALERARLVQRSGREIRILDLDGLSNI